jgi:hypothetical protein
MREWDVRDSIPRPRAADRIFKRDFPPEPIDCKATEKKDHSRPKKRELLIEPRSAERDLSRRRPAIAASGRCFSRKAFRDGGAVREMILVDSGLREPPPELRAGATAEGLTGRELDRARRLADDRDPVADGSGDDGTGTVEIACVHANRARTDACVETLERARAVDRH